MALWVARYFIMILGGLLRANNFRGSLRRAILILVILTSPSEKCTARGCGGQWSGFPSSKGLAPFLGGISSGQSKLIAAIKTLGRLRAPWEKIQSAIREDWEWWILKEWNLKAGEVAIYNSSKTSNIEKSEMGKSEMRVWSIIRGTN